MKYRVCCYVVKTFYLFSRWQMLKISGAGTKLYLCQEYQMFSGTITAQNGQHSRLILVAFFLAQPECDKRG